VKRTDAAPLICSAALAGLVSAGCGPKRVVTSPNPPQVDVVLLPDGPETTTPSSVSVTTPAGSVPLTAPYESTTVAANRPPTPPVKKDEADIRREFGAVLSELPEAPLHFSLYFNLDTSELTEESRAILPGVMSAAAARKVAEVTVIGHTDTTGSRASNYQLGLERAQAVRALLLEAGLDDSLIEVSSHGEADLLHSTPDNTSEPRNRRVEITIR
jgi:outer membrane protein OmpA-like peptidoglycan-associated protein